MTAGRFADAHELQSVEHAVAPILAETERPVEVYDGVLALIGEQLGWELGAVWEAEPGGRLHCVRTWHAGDGAPEFEALSERITLGAGEGLRGLSDRIEALGGKLELTSPVGEGTRLRAEIPLVQ